MKQIKLTKGAFAVVDNEDFEYLNQWSWHLTTKGYACRGTHTGSIKDGTRRALIFFMHREINKTPDGFQTDHINHNKLDNRRLNLRTVTNQQNHFNQRLQSNNKSGYKGVYWFRRDSNWQAQITLNARKIHLGYFEKIEDAINARKQAEKQYHAI